MIEILFEVVHFVVRSFSNNRSFQYLLMDVLDILSLEMNMVLTLPTYLEKEKITDQTMIKYLST